MVDERKFPIRVLFRDGKSLSPSHPGFTLYSRHKSGAAAESSYRELTREMPWKDAEVVDTRTCERKRYGSAGWRMGHQWDEAFTLNEPPCAEPEVVPSGVVSWGRATNVIDGARNMYGCLPCPSCGGNYRASYKRVGKRTVECDDCGYVEPGRLDE